MFIYPLVYTLMWLIPFVMHCMNYWDKWAADPVESLRVGSSIAITLMGLADALIFSLREKPWRGIDGADGSFWGSFACWRSQEVDTTGIIETGEGEGRLGARARGSASYHTSASGDYARIAAEQARARLDLEREERMSALEFKQVLKTKEDDIEEEEDGHADQCEISKKSHGQYGDRKGFDRLDVGDAKSGQVVDDTGLEDDTV